MKNIKLILIMIFIFIGSLYSQEMYLLSGPTGIGDNDFYFYRKSLFSGNVSS